MKNKLNIIVAMGNNNVIGNDNKLLWKLKTDLKFFKKTTSNCPIIMGRKTYESIGKPLPNRTNIILTNNKKYSNQYPNLHIFNDIKQSIKYINNFDSDCYVIGGSEIYKQLLPYCDELLITHVNCDLNGDTSFPRINLSKYKSDVLLDIKKSETDEYDFKTIKYYLNEI